MHRPPVRTLVAALVAFVVLTLVPGCGLLPKGEQTVNDQSGAFHMVIPGDWSVSQGPGVITLYGDSKMPDPDGAIGSTPYYFVMTATGESKGKVADELTKLAKQRAHSRGWQKTELGKPAKTRLGREEAWELDISGTDEKNRAFEGKLALARVAGSEILVFAFAEPGALSDKAYEDLKRAFYWHTPAETETTSTAKK